VSKLVTRLVEDAADELDAADVLDVPTKIFASSSSEYQCPTIKRLTAAPSSERNSSLKPASRAEVQRIIY